GHRLQLAPERLADGGFELLLPGRRQRPAEALAEDPQRRRHPEPEELADAVVIGHLQAEGGDPLRLDPQRDPVAVDQHAVAIEDHRPRRHGRNSTVSRLTRSRPGTPQTSSASTARWPSSPAPPRGSASPPPPRWPGPGPTSSSARGGPSRSPTPPARSRRWAGARSPSPPTSPTRTPASTSPRARSTSSAASTSC